MWEMFIVKENFKGLWILGICLGLNNDLKDCIFEDDIFNETFKV